MKVQQYLKQKIATCCHYELTPEDKKLLDIQGIEEYIFRKLMSKKFRKWGLPPETEKQIRDLVHYCVSSDKPIRLYLPFGGFKLWRLPTQPEADWGEFFSIAHHINFMAPILAAYHPGMEFEFSSSDIAVTAVNNIVREDVDRYASSFQVLLDLFYSAFPQNLSVTFTRLRELYRDENDFLEDVEPHLERTRKRFSDDHYFAEKYQAALQNVNIHGVRDLSLLSEKDIEAFRIRSIEVIASMSRASRVANKVDRRQTIMIMPTRLFRPFPILSLGSTRHSIAKFWAGIGVLAHDNDSYADYVLSPKQWNDVKDTPHETIKTDLISLKNFSEIRVYPQKFNFTHKDSRGI